jgi:hypothetical protein
MNFQSQLPQRRYRPHTQPRIYRAGILRSLQRLFLDDGLHRKYDGENCHRLTTAPPKFRLAIKYISFKAPFKRVAIYDAIKEHTGFDVSEMNEEQLRDVCKQLHIETDNSMGQRKTD